MYEVELKVRSSHGPVIDRLGTIEAERLDTVTQEDVYFSPPDRDFAETDEALRLRRESSGSEKQFILTYKGPRLDEKAKTRTEAETRIDDEDALRMILNGLGYERVASVHKRRIRYRVDNCTVSLDSVRDLGEFVEVEYFPESNDEESRSNRHVERAQSRTMGVLERIGLDPDEHISHSYLHLLLSQSEESNDESTKA